jgi:DNA-directed RNA polymerase specialized sigma subunit
MKERHHVAVQMEEERQWQKDNGPIVKTADQLWKYSGETEKDSTELMIEDLKETERIVLLDNGIYSVLSEKRSRILAYWMSNMDVPMKDIAEILGCDYVTVSRTIAKYLKIFKDLKNK